MESNVFSETLQMLGNKIDVQIDNDMCKKFFTYMQLITEWNKKINLTKIIEPNEIIIKHFIDSLTVAKYVKENKKIVDIGTGAGFPGIPLAILKEKNSITLVDSLQKRINFLEETKKELDLKNISCVHARAEEFSQNKQYREQYDIAVSRAVANLSVLSEYLLPAIKVNGICICMKGPNIDKEIEDAEFAIKTLGGKIISVDKFDLPTTDMSRTIIIIEKVNKTLNKYPRKAGTPSIEPISLFHT